VKTDREMAKNKLRKFAEFDAFENTFDFESGRELRGRWKEDYFGNDHPIVLELACGKGEYTVNLAKMFPNKNFIGVDRKGDGLWRGEKSGIEEKLKNIAFIRILIEDITQFFDEGEVSEIWITFPDPHPSKRREKKRLTYKRFLYLYKNILQKNGIMHLKTDSDSLYESSMEQLNAFGAHLHCFTNNLYSSNLSDEVLFIKTYYEKMYLAESKSINYIRWSFDNV